MSPYTTISFETRDGVAHVALNRPDSANSLNATLSGELMDAVVRCEDDADVRAVIVTGSGSRFFCAGADLKGFYSAGSALKSRVSIFHAVLSRLVRALLAANGPSVLAVYVGDDQTDEDAFAQLPAESITIRVGSAAVRMAARY